MSSWHNKNFTYLILHGIRSSFVSLWHFNLMKWKLSRFVVLTETLFIYVSFKIFVALLLGAATTTTTPKFQKHSTPKMIENCNRNRKINYFIIELGTMWSNNKDGRLKNWKNFEQILWINAKICITSQQKLTKIIRSNNNNKTKNKNNNKSAALRNSSGYFTEHKSLNWNWTNSIFSYFSDN